MAELDGELAGFTSYTDKGYLDLLFVNENSRAGGATRLYLEAESVWQRAGLTRATTHASLAARPFFGSQGFQVEREEEVECRGVFLRRFAMAQALIRTESK